MSSTYKVWQCNQKGIEHLKLQDFPVPDELEEYELLISVKYASLNPVDYKCCDWEGGVFGFSFPRTVGVDFSGQVIKVGSKVDTSVIVPNETFVFGHQSLKSKYCVFGELTVVDVRKITVVPNDLIQERGLEQVLSDLSAIPCAGYTAYQVVAQKLKLPLDNDPKNFSSKYIRNIVVTAGAGGVGGFTLQLLRQWRDNNFTAEEKEHVRIIATCSSNNFDTVKQLGATHAVDYNQADITKDIKAITQGEQIDAWIDLVGKDTSEQALNILGFRGELVIVVENADYTNRLFGLQLSVHNVSLGMAHLVGAQKHKDNFSFYGQEYLSLYRQNKLIIQKQLIQLEGIKDALLEMKQRHTKGKIVAKIQ